jgi:Tfp pilus assembly protein PilO
MNDYEKDSMIQLRRLLVVLLVALTLLLLSNCASQPPLPGDLTACRAEVEQLRKKLAECNADAAQCLEYLKDELSKPPN